MDIRCNLSEEVQPDNNKLRSKQAQRGDSQLKCEKTLKTENRTSVPFLHGLL